MCFCAALSLRSLIFPILNRLINIEQNKDRRYQVEVAGMFPGARVSLWASIIVQLRDTPNAAAAAGIELTVLLAASSECCWPCTLGG